MHWREGRESRRAVQALGILAVVLTAAIGTARGGGSVLSPPRRQSCAIRDARPRRPATLARVTRSPALPFRCCWRGRTARLAPRSDADIIGLPSFWATEARSPTRRQGALITAGSPALARADRAVALRPIVLAASNRWGFPGTRRSLSATSSSSTSSAGTRRRARRSSQWQWNDLLAAGTALGAGIEPQWAPSTGAAPALSCA